METERGADGKPARKRTTSSRSKKTENADASTSITSETAQEQALEWQKRLKAQYTKFKTLKNRQMILERSRRAVWAYLIEMTHENIELAKKGNSSIAKFLMDFAGVDEVPALVQASSRAKKCAGGCNCEAKTDDDPTIAVASFSKKLGFGPMKLKPPKSVETVAANDEQQAASTRN